MTPPKNFYAEVARTTIKSLYKGTVRRISPELGKQKHSKQSHKSEERGRTISQKPHPSMLDEYREFSEIQLNKGLSRQRIYQDLVRNSISRGVTAVKIMPGSCWQRPKGVYSVDFIAWRGSIMGISGL